MSILKYLGRLNKTRKIDSHKATYYDTLHQGQKIQMCIHIVMAVDRTIKNASIGQFYSCH